MKISYNPAVYPSKQASNQNIQPAYINKTQFQNITPQNQVNFTGLFDLLGGLFKKKPPLEELKELAKLAHHNPRPMTLMIEHGELEGLEEKAIEILKVEKAKAKYEHYINSFQRAIETLEKKDYYKG